MVKLKMEESGIKLTQDELIGAENVRDFMNSFYLNEKSVGDYEGRHLWVSAVAMSRKNSLQRNLKPAEVVFTIINSKNKQFSLMLVDKKTGLLTNRKIDLMDNAGNGLNVCENRFQAEYLYNKDLIKAINEMDRRISDLQVIKDRLVSLEIDLQI